MSASITTRLLVAGLVILSTLALRPAIRADDPKSPTADTPKKIVLIAGKKSHGPIGNGIHDYPWSVKLLKVMLDNSNVAGKVRVEYHLDGWPQNPETLNDADTILVVSDGRDGDKYEEAPHFASKENRDLIAKQMARGCGFATFHFSTFAPDQYAEDILSWSGGYFDWETDGKREWHSAITTLDTEVKPATPDHPVCRGVPAFSMKEEFYYNIRFRPDDAALRPILTVPALPGREPDGRVVAWARERKDGGRGFGTTCGHFYDNWKNPDFRRLILNALVWTAKADVPERGVEAKFYPHDEITAALVGVKGTERAVVDDKPIRTLILTGHQYPGHKWKDTTPALKAVLERDSRMKVDVSEEIEDLAGEKIKGYDLLVLNYCNWERPGLSDAAKVGFVKYLANGGGLVLIHFANGAFHFSLPKAGESDWPEYRNICRRVWDHTPGKSGHDAYGKFIVEIEPGDHPITAGMKAFETTDELYFRQQGTEPITVVAKARSKVTGEFEPMAFVYDYQKGRVFQTVLGHAVESINEEGTADLIRRGSAWVARREIRKASQLKPAEPAAAPQSKATIPQTEGKFGKGLNAAQGALFVEGKAEYRQPPITVECWAKVDDKGPFNILVANELKSSATHWEMFTFAGSGHYTVYMPGMTPDHVRSGIDICDGKWHYLAMTYEPERVRLYLDGKQVADQAVKPRDGETVPGQLAFGRLVSRELGCRGVLDEVRISKGVRAIDGIPDRPFAADDDTLGLWHFDHAEGEASSPDESKLKNPARVETSAGPSSASTTAKIAGHWGEDAVGFRWTEQDSVDNRWNQTDVGPFLASTVFLSEKDVVRKGLSIRVGDNAEATVCYDTADVALRAAWTGGFLRFHPARFGIINPPAIAGDVQFVLPTPKTNRPPYMPYRGLSRHANRVVLHAESGGVEWRESPWTEQRYGLRLITRTFDLAPGPAFEWPVLDAEAEIKQYEYRGIRVFSARKGSQVMAVASVGKGGGLSVQGKTQIVLSANREIGVRRVKVLTWAGPPGRLADFAEAVRASAPPENLVSLLSPGPPRWGDPLVTRGVRGEGSGPYVLDTLTIPFDNPHRALMFVSGHDFFSNGDLAVCTLHGDVWRVRGVDDSLARLTWQRYATGLFQPLGLRVVNDRVHILGRDQITRLEDRNNDGEADYYECFFNAHETSPGGHDYVTCLETDSRGRFYFIHATQGIVCVSADGKTSDIVATGFRNPNGLAVGPNDVITAAPQEGEWTPASSVIEVKPGGHYGYLGPKPGDDRPLGYDPPLCWIPRLRDNSSGGQVWVEGDRWGPLAGQLLHFSYGKCRMMLVPREKVGGVMQGGTVEFPLDFESGVMRGRFSPQDGQLYVSGLRGWVSSAVRDGCLQRVRYTGGPVDMPVAVKTHANGVAVTFTRPLDRDTAEQPDNYTVQRWNYLYSKSYGSPEFRPSSPREEGRDDVPVRSATLLEDGRTVFLEIDDLRPVHVLSIGYALRSLDQRPVEETLTWTIHAIGKDAIDPAKLTRRARAGELPADLTARLQRGLALTFEQDGRRDARIARMAAWRVEAGAPPSPFLAGGPFSARAAGFLRVATKNECRFSFEGTGKATLMINGREILSAAGDLASAMPAAAALHQGHNAIAIHYESPREGPASFRLLWSGRDFGIEAVPADAIFCDSKASDLATFGPLHRGRELFAERHCARCHVVRGAEHKSNEMPELHATAPDLGDVAARRPPEWIVAWIRNPSALHSHSTMPRLVTDDDAGRTAAADIATWLTSVSAHPESSRDDSENGRELADKGRAAYLDLGCIGCHRFTHPAEKDDVDRVSLHFTASKHRPGAIELFLQKPQRHHAWSRMPDFGLSESEAAALAAYVRSESKGALANLASANVVGDASRGKRAFQELRCGNCHAMGNEIPAKPADIALAFGRAIDRGCLADSPDAAKSIPAFLLKADDRSALRAFLATDGASLARSEPAETAQRWTRSLRCAACHTRDGAASPRAGLILDEAEADFVPEALPNLTWTGEKLRSDWTARFLRGECKSRPRPWLKARMPAFPAYADLLAKGLAAEHGIAPDEPASFAVNADLAAIGRRLTEKNSGLDCRQCHAAGALQPVGDANTQLAPGINFALTRERLRHDFYRRFVLDPPRYDIASRMPKLAADGRTTKIRDVLEGDAARQFDALWHYIQTVEEPMARPTSETARE